MSWLAWHPISGCSPTSAGCANCVAATATPLHEGLIAGRHFNGQLRFNGSELSRPADAEPSVIYVCPSGDLFHEAAEDDWLHLIFDAMEDAPWHRYIVLTKRAARMHDWLTMRYPTAVPSNFLVGVSVEDQAVADKRIPPLLALAQINRYVSVYPMLGPVNLARYLAGGRISQVNAGDESMRPARPEWFDDLSRDCHAAGVPFHRGALLPFYG